MKATDVIRRDHRAAEELFERYKKANSEDREAMEEKIFAALDAHEAMEDTYFYPNMEEELSGNDAFVQLEQEQKELEAEVTAIKAMTGDRSEAIKAAMDKVLDHAKREEREVLDIADQNVPAAKLDELGAQMEPVSAVALEKQGA